MLERLTHEDFAPHRGSVFTIHHSGTERLEAELVAVETLGRAPEAGSDRRWSFALVFQTPESDRYLVQAMYRLTHPELPEMGLFLVPLGPVETGFQYEAIFT